MKSLREKVNNY